MKNWKTAVAGVVALLVLALAAVAQSPNGVRGWFAGNVGLSSGYSLIFGDNLASDVLMGKNGSNVVGITGNIGGAGSAVNSTTSPAGPFSWGRVTLSGGAATVTFAKPFTNAPVCMGTDQTAANAVKIAPTNTTAVFTGTTTDVIAYACFGNPN
jgi:hypothetical protein